MKTFDILFACDYPSNGYPIILGVSKVPVDFFPYAGLHSSEEEAKEALLEELSDLMPDEIWEEKQNYKGLHSGTCEIIDKGDCFSLRIIKGSTTPFSVGWEEDAVS